MCCTGQPGSVKIWRDELGTLCLMFEKERDQARVFIVGLKDSIVRLSHPSRVLVEEVTHSEWTTEFHNPLHPSPIPFTQFYDQFVTELAPSAWGEEGRIAPDDTQGSSGTKDASTDIFGKDVRNEASGSNQASSSGGEPQSTTKDRVHDDAKAKKVEVELKVEGKVGHNIYPFFYRMSPRTLGCKIESLIKLQFTQQCNEEEKILEVTLDTEFKVPDEMVAHEVKLPSGGINIGVLHDELICSYYAPEAESVILVEHRPVGLSSFDQAQKTTSSSSIGYNLGGEIGLPPKLATAKITGAFSQMFGKGGKSSTSCNLDSIQGAMFVASPHFSPKLGDNALSYVGRHQIPLKGLKFEESGLPRDTKRKVSTMSMGKSASLECHGLFWVMDNSIQRHMFEASHHLGEFYLSKANKKGTEQLSICKQNLEKALLVNHGFDWALFDGRLFRRLLSSMGGGSYSSSITGLMDFP